MKRQMDHKQVIAVSEWVKKNADYIKQANSVHSASITASEDLGFPVSPSSIRSLMDVHGIDREKPQKKVMTIADGLDRAEFDRLKSDVSLIASYLAGTLLGRGNENGYALFNEIGERNK